MHLKLIFRYMRPHVRQISLSMTLKAMAAMGELLIPFVLEYIIDHVVPRGLLPPVFLWGLAMIAIAVAVRQLNIAANRSAIGVSKECIRQLRQELFVRTAHLSGHQTDAFGLPSLISRMTSDSYNVQNFMTSIQTIGIKAPMMLVGGIVITLAMDVALASILCIMAPLMIVAVTMVSRRGIPLYDNVQRKLDTIVRVMRENITGIRVVKALSKRDFEERRFRQANEDLTSSDLKASIVMAIPGPSVQMCLNLGLILVVIVGANRVNAGAMKPGVILAFLTYFNMILQGVMAFNRIFMLLSKASASADRIGLVLDTGEDQPVLPLTRERQSGSGALLEFDHVSFTHAAGEGEASAASFAGGQRAKCLDDVSFQVFRGETLGIIGVTGSGKTTIINLLMRFYDADEGGVYVDGRDVRTYGMDELRRRFGAAFQNDVIFADTLAENISLGRDLTPEDIHRAAEDAMAADFIAEKPGQYEYMADIKGANLSGGQKQRILIARALAMRPEILVLDDATSALDYKTDASLRRNIRTHYQGVTSIIVAQRISSILGADRILVLDEGRVIGYGTHEQLLDACPVYLDIYQSQMGALA